MTTDTKAVEPKIVHYLNLREPGIGGFSDATSLHRIMLNGVGDATKVKAGNDLVALYWRKDYSGSMKELAEHPEVPSRVREYAFMCLVKMTPVTGDTIKNFVSMYINPLGMEKAGEAAFRKVVKNYVKEMYYSTLMTLLDEGVYQGKSTDNNVGHVVIGKPEKAGDYVQIKITEPLRAHIAESIDKAVALKIKNAAKEFRQAHGDPSKENKSMAALSSIEKDERVKPAFRTEAKRLYQEISTMVVKGLDVKIRPSNFYNPVALIKRGLHAIEKAQVRPIKV